MNAVWTAIGATWAILAVIVSIVVCVQKPVTVTAQAPSDADLPQDWRCTCGDPLKLGVIHDQSAECEPALPYYEVVRAIATLPSFQVAPGTPLKTIAKLQNVVRMAEELRPKP